MSKTFNPNNPNVLNEYYFENSTNRYVYKESVIYLIRVVNTSVVVVFGTLLACFVFFLIAKKSPTGFKPYRKMLVLAALVDSWMIVQCGLVQTRQKKFQDIGMLSYVGILPSFLGYFYYCPILIFQSSVVLIGTSVLPVQFYYRYYTLNKEKSPSMIRTLVWFIFSLTFCSIPILNFWNTYCPAILNPELIDYGRYWYPEVPIPPLMAYPIGRMPFYKQVLSTSVLICYYFAALLIAWMTLKSLKKKLTIINQNDNVKKVQKQLSKTLFAQSLIPFFTSILPRIVLMLFAYSKLDVDYGPKVVNFIMIWYPVFNLLSTIVFIEPYWKYCMQHNPLSKNFRWRTTVLPINQT